MHGRAHRHLDGFQIEKARLAAAGENDVQQFVYFTRDFLLDRVSRFFSCGNIVSAFGGRIWQISELTSMNSLCRPCSFRNSAISLSAFWIDAGSGRDWVTVLPLTLYVRRGLGPCPGSLG
jgi:hypothetical protein